MSTFLYLHTNKRVNHSRLTRLFYVQLSIGTGVNQWGQRECAGFEHL